MKYTPILFSTEMVKAILEGRKTQTRRIVKPQPIIDEDSGRVFTGHMPAKRSPFDIHNWKEPYAEVLSPYGQPGDVLWVRETVNKGQNGQFHYKANELGPLNEVKWTPSIHMPKEACRLFLKVKDIRVERLQEISEEDAIAEGVRLYDSKKWFKHNHIFEELWQNLCGVESWEANPWVWVIEFEPCEIPENFLS